MSNSKWLNEQRKTVLVGGAYLLAHLAHLAVVEDQSLQPAILPVTLRSDSQLFVPLFQDLSHKGS